MLDGSPSFETVAGGTFEDEEVESEEVDAAATLDGSPLILELLDVVPVELGPLPPLDPLDPLSWL